MSKYRYRLSPDVVGRRQKGTYIQYPLQINVLQNDKIVSSVVIPAGQSYELQFWEWRNKNEYSNI